MYTYRTRAPTYVLPFRFLEWWRDEMSSTKEKNRSTSNISFLIPVKNWNRSSGNPSYCFCKATLTKSVSSCLTPTNNRLFVEVQYVFRNKQTNGLSVLDCISVYLKKMIGKGNPIAFPTSFPCSVISPKSGGSTYRSAVTVNDGAKALMDKGF